MLTPALCLMLLQGGAPAAQAPSQRPPASDIYLASIEPSPDGSIRVGDSKNITDLPALCVLLGVLSGLCGDPLPAVFPHRHHRGPQHLVFDRVAVCDHADDAAVEVRRGDGDHRDRFVA